MRDRDADWSAALAATPAPTAAWRVSELRLVKSTLTPKGSIYETIVRAALAGAGAVAEGGASG